MTQVLSFQISMIDPYEAAIAKVITALKNEQIGEVASQARTPLERVAAALKI